MADSLPEGAEPEQPASEANPPSFVEISEFHFDGWKVPPAGPRDLDVALGEIFADQAVQYARRIKNPAFISCVMACILRKTADHRLEPGGLEEGFLTRISKLAYAGSLN